MGIAQRARHPDELKNDNGKWIVDIDYYLAQQVFILMRHCTWFFYIMHSPGFHTETVNITDTSCGITSLCISSGNQSCSFG